MAEHISHVAIAVVERDGEYLVGTRRADEVLAGHAEFPGGKCQPGEEGAQCAVRECREEAGLEVTAIRRLHACRHTYSHGTLDLEFWLCRPASRTDTALAVGRFRWVPAQSLPSLPFPEANRAVIELLSAPTPGTS